MIVLPRGYVLLPGLVNKVVHIVEELGIFPGVALHDLESQLEHVAHDKVWLRLDHFLHDIGHGTKGWIGVVHDQFGDSTIKKLGSLIGAGSQWQIVSMPTLGVAIVIGEPHFGSELQNGTVNPES